MDGERAGWPDRLPPPLSISLVFLYICLCCLRHQGWCRRRNLALQSTSHHSHPTWIQSSTSKQAFFLPPHFLAPTSRKKQKRKKTQQHPYSSFFPSDILLLPPNLLSVSSPNPTGTDLLSVSWFVPDGVCSKPFLGNSSAHVFFAPLHRCSSLNDLEIWLCSVLVFTSRSLLCSAHTLREATFNDCSVIYHSHLLNYPSKGDWNA